jgi:hypothetical protein
MSGFGGVLHCAGPESTMKNTCDSYEWTVDGIADGQTIFVRTDCTNRAPLPNDQQDPIYQIPGVPLSREAVESMIASWKSAGHTVI